jgi:hypothetical protein
LLHATSHDMLRVASRELNVLQNKMVIKQRTVPFDVSA